MSKENQLSTLSTLALLWSADPLQVSRKTSESFELIGVRMSLSLFVQPGIFWRFVKSSDTPREGGFLARCLFAFPESTQGKRMYKGQAKTLPALDRLHRKLSDLLAIEPNMDGKSLTPSVVPLSEGALALWIESHDRTELQLKASGAFAKIRDFGSKAAENVARMAAVFQAFEGPPITEVSAENVRRASALVDWHMSEAKRCFSAGQGCEEAGESDARELLEWMISHAIKTGSKEIPSSDLGKNGPNRLRLAEHRVRPLAVLIERGCIREYSDPKRYGINPKCMPETVEDA